MGETKDDRNQNAEVGISDDQLPEDLVPSEDNPLAEGLPPGEMADDDLLNSGKPADGAEDDQSDDEPDDEPAG